VARATSWWAGGTSGAVRRASQPPKTSACIYFRNTVAIGFPNLAWPGIANACEDGDELEVHIAEGRIRNLTSGTDLRAMPLDTTMLDILSAGGLLALLAQSRTTR
jgi:3-isopropylmalate dehydratase small subunit